MKYLADMTAPDTKSKVMATFRNSLLTLLNRYLILFKDGFLGYVDQIGMGRDRFFGIWLQHMDYLTSKGAWYRMQIFSKINAIALLSLLNDLPQLGSRLEYVFKHIVPEV